MMSVQISLDNKKEEKKGNPWKGQKEQLFVVRLNECDIKKKFDFFHLGLKFEDPIIVISLSI